MTKYITNENNCLMYHYEDKNGEEKTNKISNYSLNTLFILKKILNTINSYKKTEKLIVYLEKEQQPNEKYIKVLEGEDETDYKSFFKKIHQGTVGIFENFNNNRFLLLLEMLYKNISKVEIYSNFGYQPKDNTYILGNAKISINDKTIEEYPKMLNDFNLTEDEKLQIFSVNGIFPKLFIDNNWHKILDEFTQEIVKTFNAPILMAIAVVIAFAFYDIFISKAQGVPYVILYGDSSSGKSTIINILAAIFGVTNTSKLTSGTSTTVSLRTQLEKVNNFPVFIEELDEKRIQNIEDLGKDSYSAYPRKKSSKDGTEIVTEINTSFCIGTNHFFENMTFANFSRCIPVNFRREQFDFSNFKYLNKENLEKLSCFLPEILFYRDKIPEFYEEQYKIAQKHCTLNRICNNIAIGMVIWQIVNNILKKEVVNTEKLAIDYLKYFEQYLDTELSYGDVFLSEIYKLFNKQELMYGRDFLITKGKFLRINLTKYCEIFNSNSENKKLNTAQLKLKLANDKRIVSLNATDIKPIGKAIKIDISDNPTLLDIKNRVISRMENEETDNE